MNLHVHVVFKEKVGLFEQGEICSIGYRTPSQPAATICQEKQCCMIVTL